MTNRVPGTVSRVLKHHNLNSGDVYEEAAQQAVEAAEANVATSLAVGDFGDSDLFGGPMHYPVLDIDLPCELVPSSTPGHFHLYIDHPVSDGAYWDLIAAMVACGIVQPGYLGASRARGYTAARLPWVRKEVTA